MPLYPDALAKMRANLEEIVAGRKAETVAIGFFTDQQLAAINAARRDRKNHLGQPAPFPPLEKEIVFIGQHSYDSRIRDDGYTVDDVLDQIVSGMSEHSAFVPTSRQTAIQNHTKRQDRYGSMVRDMIIFECTTKLPRAELLSPIPKGDEPPNPNANSLHKRGKGHRKVTSSS